ncbi:MAG TPA: hypothetical protein VGL25_17685 [Casimicrobiaceae bacterium]
MHTPQTADPVDGSAQSGHAIVARGNALAHGRHNNALPHGAAHNAHD